MKKITICIFVPIILLITQCNTTQQVPEWVHSMRRLHMGFDGQEGYVAQFGDSMTYTMAFWNPLKRDDPAQYITANDGIPFRPNGKQWSDVILGTEDKGPEHGNFSGWTSGQVRKSVEKVIHRKKPEVAIIQVGSNDIRKGAVPEDYRVNLEAIVDSCLEIHCIPMLNTIPPFRGREDAVDAVNRIIREVALSKKVPLVEYYSACLKYRPGNSWYGTLISQDGIHPTGGMASDYSEDNLKNSGYALRNWVNFLVYREIYFKVLNPKI